MSQLGVGLWINCQQTNHKWECYIGEIYERIIRDYPIDKYNTVVEFAPGYRYKIGYALSKVNFEGDLYVIDSNENVINYIVSKYNELLPKAKVIGICKPLIEALPLLPQNIDLFLSNHSIDDMIIGKYLSNEEAVSVFNDEYGSKEKLLAKWEELSFNHVILNDIKNSVLDEWKKLFKIKNISLVVVSQYKCNSYFANEGQIMEEITRDVFNKIKELNFTDHAYLRSILNFKTSEDDERFVESGLINNTQNADNWIVSYNNY